jgi:hypothetical protein
MYSSLYFWCHFLALYILFNAVCVCNCAKEPKLSKPSKPLDPVKVERANAAYRIKIENERAAKQRKIDKWRVENERKGVRALGWADKHRMFKMSHPEWYTAEQVNDPSVW